MNERIIAVRGATTTDCDTREEVTRKTVELFRELVRKNGIDGVHTRCVSAIIGTTTDIRSFYPARAVRESGVLDAPLFSCSEPETEGGLPLCIRVLLTLATDRSAQREQHVYLHKAATLRPDLAGE